jgi:hypothetical protein
MLYESAVALCIGLIAGYWFGQQNMIKMHRRLYNLNTNFNLLYAEHTEKDKIFDEIRKSESTTKKVFGLNG